MANKSSSWTNPDTATEETSKDEKTVDNESENVNLVSDEQV